MPVNAYFKGHGDEVMDAMTKEYGAKKGKSVFYATANKRGVKPMAFGGMTVPELPEEDPNDPNVQLRRMQQAQIGVPQGPAPPPPPSSIPDVPPAPITPPAEPGTTLAAGPVKVEPPPDPGAPPMAPEPPAPAPAPMPEPSGQALEEGPDTPPPPPQPIGRASGQPLRNQGKVQQQEVDYGRAIADTNLDKNGKPKNPSVLTNILGGVLNARRGIDLHPNQTYQRNQMATLGAAADAERKMESAQSNEVLKREQIDATREGRLLSLAQRQALAKTQPGTPAEQIKLWMDAGYSQEQAMQIVQAGGKLQPPKVTTKGFGSSPLGIYSKDTGNVTTVAPEKEKTPSGDFQAVFLPAYAKSLGKTVDQLTPEETMKAFSAHKEYNSDPEVRASVLASRASLEATRAMAAGQEPTVEQARDVARDIISHRIAPEQVASMFGGFGKSGQAFKRMVYHEGKLIDPEFNYEQASAEYALTKSPSFQTTIRYMDSVRQSIPQVIQAATTLANGKIKIINSLRTTGLKQFNNVDLGKFNTDRILVADEIGKLLAGGGTGNVTSDSKLSLAMAIIKETDDPALVAANLGEVDKLLGFRRGSLTKGTYFERPEEQHGSGGLPAPGQMFRGHKVLRVEEIK